MLFMSLLMTYSVFTHDYGTQYHDDVEYDVDSFDTLADMQAFCNAKSANGCIVLAVDADASSVFEHYPA